ncbi:hypothetical protein [uncultured Aquimonas sp.]|uniref:hypothetical protein n=1 Tax=uncultured Aquimonas sp. TaxID=385483 RepID=UPI0026306833|nr:hypothetical protein [uncultured Aquimonas sp.]
MNAGTMSADRNRVWHRANALDESFVAAALVITLYRDRLGEIENPHWRVIAEADDEMAIACSCKQKFLATLNRSPELKPATVAKLATIASDIADRVRNARLILARHLQETEGSEQSAFSRIATGADGLLQLAEHDMEALRMEVTA